MKALIQRVSEAKVLVDTALIGEIKQGLLVFLGVEELDTEADSDYLLKKIRQLRVFSDENQKMNLSVQDIGAEILCVSQFTLIADCRKSNRPSFSKAAKPQEAERLYNYFVSQAKLFGLKIETGKFAANMQVELTNDGPVTIMLESKKS